MLFLDMLIAIFIQLTMIFGTFGATVIVLAAAGFGTLFTYWFVNWLVESFFGMGGTLPVDYIERRKGGGGKRVRQLEAMDIPRLQQVIDSHPEDVPAARVLCEKLRTSGQNSQYADALRHILKVDEEMDLQERATKHHQLADLYLGPLGCPELGCRALEEFVENYDETNEGRMMRKRLERIRESKSGAG